MSEEDKNQNQNDKDGEKQVISLKPETYNALLDRLEELEEEVKNGGGGKDKGKSEDEDLDELDRLAREGKKGGKKDEDREVDFDSLSNRELAKTIVDGLTTNVISPLMVKLEEITIQREIDSIKRAEEAKGEKGVNFDDYEDDVFELCKQNPELPVKRAFKLAISERGDKKKTPKDEDKDKRDEKLRHLPARPDLGEKPSGMSERVTKKGEPKTREEAADRAWDEVVEGEK